MAVVGPSSAAGHIAAVVVRMIAVIVRTSTILAVPLTIQSSEIPRKEGE
jgi:hypothetical protein